MKRVSVFAGVLLAALSQAQVKLSILVNGKQTGTAVFSERLNDKGDKIVNLGITLTSNGDTITIRSESRFNSKGEPLRKYQETSVKGRRGSSQTIAEFDNDGANVVLITNGERTTKHVPLKDKSSGADLSEFWLIRDAPQVGDVVTAQTFNLDKLEWQTTNTTYKGVRPLSVGGRRVTSYVTDSEKGTAFLDKDGLPLRLELPGAVMERIWEN